MKPFLFALLLSAAAAAEPTAEDLARRLERNWDPWKDCAPGTWIQMRTTTRSAGQGSENGTEFRQTLLARDKTGLKIETRTVKRIVDAQGAEKIELGEPTVMTQDVAGGTTYKDVKEHDKETVQVGDRKLECRVIEATATYSYTPPGGQKMETTWKVKLWVSDEVKDMGGVVKSETDAGNQNAVAGMGSSDMKLIETDKDVKIGATTHKCSVYKYGSASGNETNVSSGELWMCADVPAGYAKIVSHMKMKANGMNMEMDTEVVITDMSIARPKED